MGAVTVAEERAAVKGVSPAAVVEEQLPPC
jgi:hypothetical protein